ncbi:HdeD family acid-resistance protein [Listeria ivanovii]|uniref:HdeD protein n=1 Tax=Listeria ivanovii (strain ATCC BAA-678 / PAM 55) TaxID=881621 RepID=G2ZAF2_LISIP|nr:HdeD family acid-resistance protein [Listeria ivanovii]AHI55111.1 membrane protein [Listeria ivanovii WSLC3009]AIS64570.1 membrane protein [Listeria ivanovii subsp. ivanovii]MBC1758759.1 HdeD family acid-resistance protein [Listeria ivanovii]MBK3913617.1 HdeD family acid-resistance protein [Listeria ivanovii subsp. ivanovii]MBK3920265.1 HdeD family acid-resistance protein [Listeria ivanovii subsp. ivanovii]
MKTFTRILVLLAGIAMIVLGIWFLFHPGISLLTSTLMFGFLLLISGIFHTVSYFSDKKMQKVSGWVLADGILSILLGFLLLFNDFAGTATLVLLFGMWVLFAGIMRTIGAFTAKQNNVQGWGWILTIGIIGIIVGFIALFNPVVSAIGIVLIVGIFFIVQGISAIATFFFIGKMN